MADRPDAGGLTYLPLAARLVMGAGHPRHAAPGRARRAARHAGRVHHLQRAGRGHVGEIRAAGFEATRSVWLRDVRPPDDSATAIYDRLWFSSDEVR